MERPRPVPSPAGFVVKNGLNIFSFTSGALAAGGHAAAETAITLMNSRGAESEEKHEPASDIDPGVVDSLKALDLKRPIREADIGGANRNVRFGAKSGHLRHRADYACLPDSVRNTATRGKMTLISVNTPGCVSTSIAPPCCLTTMS